MYMYQIATLIRIKRSRYGFFTMSTFLLNWRDKMMSNIETAYLLQRKLDLIKENKKVLKDGSHIYFLKKLKREFDHKKKEYILKKEGLGNIKENYQGISEKIKNVKKEIDENEFKLYNKVGSDLNAIDKLEKSIEKGKQELKKLEDDAVELLEQEEKIDFIIENLRLELVNVKNNFYDYKEKSSKKIDEADYNIKLFEKEIEELKKDIPDNMLGEIEKILKYNDTAVVKLVGAVCDGCKMKVSAMTMDSVNRGVEIVHCDNCGRILYYDSESLAKNVKKGKAKSKTK